MPSLKTEEQWEASACLKKRKNQSDGKTHFRLCVACIKRMDDPSAVEPCWGAPHPPCPSIKEGEPTIQQAQKDFLCCQTTNHCTADDVESSLDLLNTSLSRCWDCHECKYWEAPNGYEEAFITTHGVSWISRQIPRFLPISLFASA